MDFSRDGLNAAGFTGFVRVVNLKTPGGCNVIPRQEGVYVVAREGSVAPAFLERSIGGYFKNEDPTVPIDELRRNWVDGAYVVYIGKAGGSGSSATLRSRLKQYMDFGCGKPVGHRGGRMIWQLDGSDNLLVAWKSLSHEEPRLVEQYLIQEFAHTYGKRPFANLIG